jgi:hypothetical protein
MSPHNRLVCNGYTDDHAAIELAATIQETPPAIGSCGLVAKDCFTVAAR